MNLARARHVEDAAAFRRTLDAIRMRVGGYEELARRMSDRIAGHQRRSGGPLLVAVSGGVDSAVVVFLAAAAVGAERVTGVWMPLWSGDSAGARAELVCRRSGAAMLSVALATSSAARSPR